MKNQSNGNSGAGELWRSRYFPRQLVTAADLTNDQNYFRELWRLHNRLLHGCGVVCGLEVLPSPTSSESGSELSVIVTSGYALSPQGDGIWVREDQVIPVAKPSTEACLALEPLQVRQKVYYLAIRYQETDVKPMPTAPERCISNNNCEYSRTQASFEIKCLDYCPKTCHPPEIDCGDLEEGQILPRLPPTRKEDIPALFTCPPKIQEPWVVLGCLHISSSGRLIIDYGERIQILSTQALQELLTTKPCQEETEEEEMLEFTKKGKIGTGETKPTDWKLFPVPIPGSDATIPTLKVEVDTSATGFTKTPVYVTAIHGNGLQIFTTGANSIVNPTPKSFEVYITVSEAELAAGLTAQNAASWGWYIQWVGIED